MTRTATRSIALRLIAVAVAAVALTAAVTPCAFADKISAAKAQAAKVQAQVNALNTKAEIASEEYDAARMHYATLSTQAAASAVALKKVTRQRDVLQSQLDGRATALYRQGPLGFLGALLSARNISDFDAVYQMLTNMSRHDAVTVDRLKVAKEHADAVHSRLADQRQQAGVQQRAMASNAAAVKAHLAKSKQVLAQANSTVRTLIAEQKAREAAAARAAAALANAGSGSGRAFNRANFGNPPVSGVGAKAVWYAETRLGCPYVWAASGPNEFDCSGLTMWAYEQVGIHLNHYSRDQINEGKSVSKSNLQPGDLVFFGSPIHHVGMYVGGGRFIEAPYSGANVRISNLSNRGDFAGACRP